MTQTLETVTGAPVSAAELERMVYGDAYERAPYVAAQHLMDATQKANELYQEAHALAGEERGRLLYRANAKLEYAALCAALPVYQERLKERSFSGNPNLARAWVPYPNKVVPVDIFPVAVMDVLHDEAKREHEERYPQTSTEVDLIEPAISEDVTNGEQALVIDVMPEQEQPRRRGFARVLGWLTLGRWGRKR